MRTPSTARLRVLVLFGGRSSEHEVSCLSARSVLAALDREHYQVTTVGITRDGRWSLVDGVADTLAGTLPSVPDDGATVALVATRKGTRLVLLDDDGLVTAKDPSDSRRGAAPVQDLGPVDVCFPVLHGPYGEDGTVQGLLASYGVPYVGADVAASAVGVDKRQMKNVFTARALPQAPYLAVSREQWDRHRDRVAGEVERAVGYPAFSKPARQGSSIGIRRCADRPGLLAGLEEAFSHDRVAIVEQAVTGVRELECGVLGNGEVEVSQPGEVLTCHEFYDFEAKYLDEVELRCPADVPDAVRETCRDYARQAYRAIGARGMARVDLFYVERSGLVLVNEINTIPGFTPTSMFPYVWAAEGLDYPRLIDRLLSLALAAGRSEARYAP